MQKSSSIVVLIGILLLVGFGCRRVPESTKGSVEIDRDQILSEARKSGLIMDVEEIARMAETTVQQRISGSSPSNVSDYISKEVLGWKSAALADVTGGGSFGLAFLQTENGYSTLIAKVGNLPALEEGQWYEGWVVKRGDEMRVGSVGSVVPAGDQYAIVFITQTDLSDYDFFVLTREQQDENSLPSQHVLEGSFR